MKILLTNSLFSKETGLQSATLLKKKLSTSVSGKFGKSLIHFKFQKQPLAGVWQGIFKSFAKFREKTVMYPKIFWEYRFQQENWDRKPKRT